MDDQNSGNTGVGDSPLGGGAPTPTADQGGTPPAAEPMEQKCVTCGNSASSGNCVACGQGEASCSCVPATGGEPGLGEPAPSAPVV